MNFVSLSCIVQILWQYQVMIEATIPIFVIEKKMEADK